MWNEVDLCAIQELSSDHDNTKRAAADGMKFLCNSEAWMDTMILMGHSLAARVQKLKTRHALILNFYDGANNWNFANRHLPTSWASVTEVKDAVWKVHEILEHIQEKTGRGTKINTAIDFNTDIFEEYGPRPECQRLANWLVSRDI